MELNIYEIIKGPVASEKAYELYQKLNKVCIYVHPFSNKILIKKAVETLFDVLVENIRVLVRKGKKKVSRNRNVSIDPLKKIAIITLKSGYDINLFGEVPNKKEKMPVSNKE